MKIAVFLPNWIGDAVMATPAIRALRRHFQEAEFTAVLRPYVAGVLEGAPWFDRQLLLNNKGKWSEQWPFVSLQLRRHRPDLAVLFPNSFRSALVARLGGCRESIGFKRYLRGPLLTRPLEPVRDAFGRLKPSPVIDDYNALARSAGCRDTDYRMELFTLPKDEAGADAVWEKGKLHQYPELICLNPGAAFGAAKYWPADYFAQLARNLVDWRGAGVLILCGPNERALAQQIAGLAQRPAVHTLADFPPSLGLTKACVRRADLLITTDSGPRHFAAAFNKPVVSLFGPTHIWWTVTYHPKEICLQKKVPCGPCQRRVCPLDHRCMNELRPDEVFRAATFLLTRNAAGPKRIPVPLPARGNPSPPVQPARKAS